MVRGSSTDTKSNNSNAPEKNNTVRVYQNLSMDSALKFLRDLKCSFYVPIDKDTDEFHPLKYTGGRLHMKQIEDLMCDKETGAIMLDYRDDPRGVRFFVMDIGILAELMPGVHHVKGQFIVIVAEAAHQYCAKKK